VKRETNKQTITLTTKQTECQNWQKKIAELCYYVIKYAPNCYTGRSCKSHYL